MAFKFEKLEIWNRAVDLSDEINDVVKNFPRFEVYNLCLQIRKAADSVALKIAEGSTGQSNAEQARFLNYSIRSAIEVVSCLFLAKKRHYVEITQFNYLYKKYEALVKMITRFRDSLR